MVKSDNDFKHRVTVEIGGKAGVNLCELGEGGLSGIKPRGLT